MHGWPDNLKNNDSANKQPLENRYWQTPIFAWLPIRFTEFLSHERVYVCLCVWWICRMTWWIPPMMIATVTQCALWRCIRSIAWHATSNTIFGLDCISSAQRCIRIGFDIGCTMCIRFRCIGIGIWCAIFIATGSRVRLIRCDTVAADLIQICLQIGIVFLYEFWFLITHNNQVRFFLLVNERNCCLVMIWCV